MTKFITMFLSDKMIITFFSGIIALLFSSFLAFNILKKSEGTNDMKKIALAIRQGANAYLKRQYKGVVLFFSLSFFILIMLAYNNMIDPFVPLAFMTGGFFSGLTGFLGMKIATNSNARTAFAAKEGLNSALKIAFSAGAVMGFVVVGIGLLDISIWYFILKIYYMYLNDQEKIARIASTMLTFGMGASSMALFARVGGGIFTKAADVGADLVGKIEVGIPEDDARNPAVIADNVGDNVGDVAGMGADLYESYIGARISASALAISAGLGYNGFILPMLIAALGMFASLIGTFFVKTNENATQKNLLVSLRKGTYAAATIVAIFSYFLTKFILKNNFFGVYVSLLIGLLTGIIIGFITEYYTSEIYTPTKELCKSTVTGPATFIISGLSLGMFSTTVPVILIGISVLSSFIVSNGLKNHSMGLYGIAISAVGMLSTLAITLATDAYGPVADNAGGIAEMAKMGSDVRNRTDALDALGNTTAATGKGFAIGSAALTALALIVSFIDQVKIIKPNFVFNLQITNPSVLIGLFIGAMIPFLFAALTMSSVGKTAQMIVIEVRRQIKEQPGIITGDVTPDYASCVDICTKASQKEILKPALLTIITPIIIGLILGVNGVAGLLAGSTVTGFILALVMSNSGGAWDNAKKYIEKGNYGGKNSDAHKAAVIGDTVGDPFKDTSGPSINILIKLVSIVSIVFISIITSYSIF